jgi:2-methylcitrate dehydratase PrpD
MTFKKFPSCGCNHAPIEATLQLMKEHKLKPEQIETVEVTISPYMARLVGAKYDPAQNPIVAAQFSVQYSVASAILRGRLGLTELTPAAVRDPGVLGIAHKVNVIVDETRRGAGLEGAVALGTSQGKLTKAIHDLPGSPQNPMSEADFAAKAVECFSSGVAPLTASQARAVLGRIEAIDQLDDVSTFFSGISGLSAHDRRSA